MENHDYIKSLLRPNGSKPKGRKVWSVDLEAVWLPFFNATNAMGETAIAPDTLGAPLRLAYERDGSVRFSPTNGKPVIRVAPDLQANIKLVRENFVAGLMAYTHEVFTENPDAYRAQVEASQSAGQPIIEVDRVHLANAYAVLMSPSPDGRKSKQKHQKNHQSQSLAKSSMRMAANVRPTLERGKDMPKWANPQRQAHLVNLFRRSGGFCVFGESPCSNPEQHHYELFIDGLIDDWRADDRAQQWADWQAEQKALHSLGEVGRIKGEFNSIARDVFFANQVVYHFESIGISGLTFRPFAKVRLTSSFIALHVDIGDAMRTVSKNQRRKAMRYSKITPDVKKEVDRLCSMAVKDYLK